MKRSARIARRSATFAALASFVLGCTPRPTSGGAESADLPLEPARCVIPLRADEPASDKLAKNVDGAPLATCSTAPMTGVYRNGRCATGPDDVGVHVVCAKVTEEFLRFTVAHGNDLVTPARGFPGLQAGSRWCLCAARWAEVEAAGVAPPVVLEATESRALRSISRRDLDAHALRGTEP